MDEGTTLLEKTDREDDIYDDDDPISIKSSV